LWAITLLLLASSVVFGSWHAWRYIARQPEFQVSLEAFSLNDAPEWVKAGPMSTELRETLREGWTGDPRDDRNHTMEASIFASDTAAAIARALRRSPWLVEVTRVERRLPNSMHIEADFRQPAGVVFYEQQTYMVDTDGYWLPDRLFARPRGWAGPRMPVIERSGLTEPPPYGYRWDGPRIAIGARLTDYLRQQGLLDQLHVRVIDVAGVAARGREIGVILRTAEGAIVEWGRTDDYGDVPGLEKDPFQVPDAEKLAMLRNTLNDHPGLEGIASLNLRFHGKTTFVEGL
jgi:hypothetical protein